MGEAAKRKRRSTARTPRTPELESSPPRPKARIAVIHWNSAHGDTGAGMLRAAGYDVLASPIDGALLRRLRDDPPAAFVIDLSRQPSAGRDAALFWRAAKQTRSVPIVFVEGEAEKVAGVRALLPDAVFTAWARARTAVARVLAKPPREFVRPGSVLAGYSGTPLPKKLGVREGSVVLLVGAPKGFEETLGALPEGAVVRRRAATRADVTLWFTRSVGELQLGVKGMIPRAEKGGLWIIWPKKTSGVASDLSETEVRRIGLAAGLVDYKVCAVDATWSGLKFSKVKR